MQTKFMFRNYAHTPHEYEVFAFPDDGEVSRIMILSNRMRNEYGWWIKFLDNDWMVRETNNPQGGFMYILVRDAVGARDVGYLPMHQFDYKRTGAQTIEYIPSAVIG